MGQIRQRQRGVVLFDHVSGGLGDPPVDFRLAVGPKIEQRKNTQLTLQVIAQCIGLV